MTKDQATERDRLGKLKEEVDAAQASHTKLVSEEKDRLEAREKSLVVAEKAVFAGRDAFISLELRPRMALQTLYGEGYEESLASPEEGLAGLLPKLTASLEGIIAGVGAMVEAESHALFISAATHVFSHIHLRDPSFDLGVLLEPVAPEFHEAAAEAVGKQVEALL